MNTGYKQELIGRAMQVTPGGVHSAIRKLEPYTAWKTGKGAYLWDVEDRRYIDYNAAWGAVILGYSYPEVKKAVINTVENYDLYGGSTTELEVKFAEMVCKHVPSIDKCLICSSGSEATYHAIRVSRGYTGRQKIIKFQGGFHGWHDYVLMNNYSTADKMYKRNPGSKGMLEAAIDHTLICRFNDLENVQNTVKKNPDQIAAIIIEPIAHNLGAVVMEDEFLKGLRSLCDKNGIVLIYDEVITGFRVGMGGYQSICNVLPDLTTMGKAMGNGYPIAIVGGKREIMDRFNTNKTGDVVFQGTYNAHPSVLAAAIATMEALIKKNVHNYIFEMGTYFRNGLQGIFDRLGIEATMLGYGSIMVPLWTHGPFKNQDDLMRADAARSIAFRKAMIDRGYYMAPAEPKRLVISYSHTKDDLDETLQAAEDVLKKM